MIEEKTHLWTFAVWAIFHTFLKQNRFTIRFESVAVFLLLLPIFSAKWYWIKVLFLLLLSLSLLLLLGYHIFCLSICFWNSFSHVKQRIMHTNVENIRNFFLITTKYFEHKIGCSLLLLNVCHCQLRWYFDIECCFPIAKWLIKAVQFTMVSI